jgi:dienelactone hydrolase
MKPRIALLVAALLFARVAVRAQQPPATLPGTQPLTMKGDLSAQMVAGIDAFLLRETAKASAERAKFWKRDLSSREAYEASIATNRARLREVIGAVDARLPVKEIEFAGTTATPAKVAETDRYTVFAVRWPVFDGVFAEGLLLEPKGAPRARVVALPDADQTPEQVVGMAPGVAPESQFARTLAEHRCQVLVLTLVDRRDNWSGSAALNRFTNQPHREWIYRQAFELGRHIIGYEVQKVLAAVDWFEHLNAAPAGSALPIGVAGYGEGGMLALCSAALDPRIGATLVSGFFGPRERVWEQPIYRNIWRLVLEFGDAEVASLSTKPLFVEHSVEPKVSGPPAAKPGRSAGAAPGRIETAEGDVVAAEVVRARNLLAGGAQPLKPIAHFTGDAGKAAEPFNTGALAAFIRTLGAAPRNADENPGAPPVDLRANFSPDDRQQRAVRQLEAHTQRLLALCERTRGAFLWNKVKPASPAEWTRAMEPFKKVFWEDVIGKFPPATGPLNARSRKCHDKPAWTGYEVVLDVWPDVFAWGVLLLPKDLKPGERRPVVVTQHGLEGVPEDTIVDDPQNRAFAPYKAFSARLAEQGFIVFAPHNPYRGRDAFRTLQRKANPLGRSLFSVILGQHERILDWLSAQPFVDPQRIGFYGLSYGGKSAMRIPAALDRYCLSICSADFNEWVKKNATVDWPFSYMFTGEYEIFEWNLGGTFNYAEMGALIAPRPFMVERGHNDGVGYDEFVAYEFAKVNRLYGYLGIPKQTEIEYFDGPHTINGVGTYDFLRRLLKWPPKQ